MSFEMEECLFYLKDKNNLKYFKINRPQLIISYT
jgi:hypothetical protein